MATPVITQAKANATNKGGALYFSKEQVDQIFAAGGSFVKGDDKNYQISAGHRTTPGQAEIHGKNTDIFFVVDGSATLVTGGTVVDAKTTAPDEIRGTAITGGEVHQLSKGDLMVIPHGTPHWMQQVQGTFQYLVVKVR
jgi:mannose-6-phosphate isomerase-like protein (cupin superfamily)